MYQDWSTDTMLEVYGEVKLRAESVDWPLKTYVDYMNDNHDESPLYLFDRSFVEKLDLNVGKDGQYWSPESFGEDLFAVLGDQRPDSRWLIVGPERSGSTFHKDPNATRSVSCVPVLVALADEVHSAWNAVLKGSKYWIMFPSSSSQPPPPGVFVSEDQSEVTSPLSIAEWLLGFHAAARATHGCREGICNQGEVLHVPSGWWHLVVNLEPSIAITQNFVPETHLTNVLGFLRNKPDQISGFKKEVENPYELFVDKMQALHPELLERVLQEMDLQQGKKRKWDQLVGDNQEDNANTGGFSFRFGGAENVEVP